MNATIYFDENGSEYTGYFRALNASRFAFDPARSKAIDIDGVRIELDESINRIEIDGYHASAPIDEAWELPAASEVHEDA